MDEVGPGVVVRNKEDLMRTAQVETFVEVKI